ncbi:MAG: type II secretion system F family protein [Nocardioidaceae bacterium]
MLLAAFAAGLAAAMATRSGSSTLVRRRLGVGRAGFRDSAVRTRLLAAVVSVAATCVALLVLGDRPQLVLVAVAAGGAGYAGVSLRRKTRQRALRHRRQAETVDICDAIVAELAAGSPPSRALTQVAADWPVLAAAARTAELGGEVADALRALSHESGRDSFHEVAAAWQVSLRSGAGLAGVLDRLSATLRRDDEARQEVIAALGAPRATARVLAVLPAFGLALGAGIGGDPVAVLLETMLGAVCLLVGSALAVAGLFWVEHIADTAELV